MDAPIQQNNYVAKIFDVLDNAVKEGQDDPEGALDGKEYKVDYPQCIRPTYSLLYLALDITPVLFSAFLEAFRQKRNTSTSAMQDTSRMAEFGFFVYMLKIIHHSQDLYLETLSRLLKAFVQWNVYHTRNDDITKSQREILNQIADEIVSYLNNDTKRKYDMMIGKKRKEWQT
jgi:5-methylthioribose kinase